MRDIRRVRKGRSAMHTGTHAHTHSAVAHTHKHTQAHTSTHKHTQAHTSAHTHAAAPPVLHHPAHSHVQLPFTWPASSSGDAHAGIMPLVSFVAVRRPTTSSRTATMHLRSSDRAPRGAGPSPPPLMSTMATKSKAAERWPGVRPFAGFPGWPGGLGASHELVSMPEPRVGLSAQPIFGIAAPSPPHGPRARAVGRGAVSGGAARRFIKWPNSSWRGRVCHVEMVTGRAPHRAPGPPPPTPSRAPLPLPSLPAHAQQCLLFVNFPGGSGLERWVWHDPLPSGVLVAAAVVTCVRGGVAWPGHMLAGRRG